MRIATIIIAVLALSITACTMQVDGPYNQTNTTPAENNDTTPEITDDFEGVDVEAHVEAWIKAQPTYAYDGQNLELQNHLIQESYPAQHVLTYTFTSTQAGYGDRSDEMVAQVLTDHTITVRAVDGEITHAIIDERWNEITQEPVNEQNTQNQSGQSTATLSFQPEQCESYAWDEWYAQGNNQYVQEPTEEQLITDYYASQNISVEVERVQESDFVCQACGCPQTYSYDATLEAQHTSTLEADGWN